MGPERELASFSASSPIERSRTSRLGDAQDLLREDRTHVRELDEVLGRASAFAPASMRTLGRGVPGSTTAIPARTPGRRRRWRSDAASIAPVLPAETTACASPSETARTARTSDEPGFDRTASTGDSSISIERRPPRAPTRGGRARDAP